MLLTAYRCEPSWLLQRDTQPVYDTGPRNCSRHVTTVSECLEACLATSFRCAGVTVSPVVDDDVIECRLYAHEYQLRKTRDVTGTDLYILHSHCYAVGKFCLRFSSNVLSVTITTRKPCYRRENRAMPL